VGEFNEKLTQTGRVLAQNQHSGSLSAKISLEVPMMSTPAAAIKDEVRLLIDIQIETFRQPTPLTHSQLREYHYRSEKLKMLCHELNRIGARNVLEQRMERAS
jgi:hypothetical protein